MDEYEYVEEGEAVQLVTPKDAESGDAGGFTLNDDVLVEIFHDDKVKDKPVAIYSLTGAFRKGKSFLLNLFLRYLWADNKEEWIGDLAERLSKGFGWRGGMDGDTQGIWIWNKPFRYNTPQGEVNLFLMDTQGAFDLEVEIKSSSVIFALSTLIGSVQIYNVMQMIGADDLQSLHLFAEYGKSATKLAAKSHIKDAKPFQHLIFLIRDWADKDLEFGEKGGKEYLAKVFNKKSKSKEIKKVQEDIKNYFTNFTCYLLPSPGKTVMERGANDKKVKLGEVDERFLNEVGKLQRHLFDSENLVVKTNSGKLTTGAQLYNFIQSYFKVFESGKMPQVATILEANMRASMSSVILECVAVFRNGMQKECAVYLSPELFDAKQNSFRKLALEHYEDLPKMGDSKFLSLSKNMLNNQIDQELEVFVQTNITNKEKLKAEVRDILEATVSAFKHDLNKESGETYVDDATLDKIKQECYERASKSFLDQTKDYDESTMDGYRTKLGEVMNNVFAEFADSNLYRLSDLKRKLSDLSIEARQKFIEISEENCGGKVLESKDLKETLSKARVSALSIFDDSEIGNGSEVKKEIRPSLVNEINAQWKKFEETNDINRRLDEAQTLQTLTQAKEAYNTYIKGVCGDGYIDPSKIDTAHKKAKEQAEVIIDLSLGSKGESFVKKCKAQLDEVLAVAIGDLKQQNGRRKEKTINEFRNHKMMSYEKYKSSMIEFTNGVYRNDDALFVKHGENKAIALNNYSDVCPKEPAKELDSNKKELDSDIENYFLTVKKGNNHQEMLAKERAESQLEIIKKKHMETLNNLTKDKCVKPEVLRKKHDDSKNELLATLSSVVGVTKHAQTILPAFATEAEKIFGNVSKANAVKNKGCTIL